MSFNHERNHCHSTWLEHSQRWLLVQIGEHGYLFIAFDKLRKRQALRRILSMMESSVAMVEMLMKQNAIPNAYTKKSEKHKKTTKQ